MRWVRECKNGVRFLLGRRAKQQELDKEIEFHIEEAIEDLMAQGMSQQEARRIAKAEFGGVENLKEECRDVWGVRVLSNLWRDLVFSIRLLWKDKAYSTLLIFTFVFCVGPGAVVFNLFNSLYLNPDRYPDEDRIVRIYDRFEGYARSIEKRKATNAVLFTERRDQSQLIDSIDIQGLDHVNVQVSPGEVPEFLDTLLATPSFFDVLRIEPALGERLSPDSSGMMGRKKEVVLTHAWWMSRYNGDAAVIGRSLTIDGEGFEIKGVMPEGFSIPPLWGDFDVAKVGLITPYPFSERSLRPQRRFSTSPVGCLARMKPGVTRKMLEDELASINAENQSKYPAFERFVAEHPHLTGTVSVGEDQLRDFGASFTFAFLMAGFVVIAGGFSIANFVLARNSCRIQEFATRFSLGGSEFRLAFQLAVEAFVLVGIGFALSLVSAQLGLLALDRFGHLGFFAAAPRVHLDADAVWLATGLCVIIWSICTFVSTKSISIAMGRSLSQALKEGGRTGTASARVKSFRGTLILAQSAVAFALLVNGGLLARSFWEVLDIDPGYQTDDLLFTTIRMPSGRYGGDLRESKMTEIENRIRSLPEVESVGVSNWPPMKHTNIYRHRVVRFENPDLNNAIFASSDKVSPGYFDALGITPLRGRLFTDGDVANRSLVIVIDEALANRLFPGENPIGKRIAMHTASGPPPTAASHSWLTVIGVVNSVRINDLYTPSSGMIYNHVGGQWLYWFGYVVKVRSTVQEAIAAMQNLLLAMEPDVAVGQPMALDQAIEIRYADRKRILYFCLGLAGLGVALALVGIMGVISYSIAAQKKEIGIRLALGAKRGAIMRGSVRFWLRITAMGVGLGLLGSIVSSERVKALLYRVEPLDPGTYATATIVFAIAVTIAAYAAARKTSSIEPLDGLRD